MSPPRGPLTSARPLLPAALALVTATIVALTAAGCGGGGAALGRIPIPVPPRDPTPVTAEAGHPQLVVTGDPVRVVTASGTTVLARADGPALAVASPGPGGQPPSQAFATLTISVTGITGPPLAVSPGDFQVRDEVGALVPMTPDSGGGAAGPGDTVTLHLVGTISSGNASVTWAPGGGPLVVWDFVIETD